MPTVLVNPLDETPRATQEEAPRLDTLAGKTIALLDISKPGGSYFLDRLESVLKQRFGVSSVFRISKPTFTKPAPADIIDRLVKSGSSAVIEALAD
jgi:hypothetical protein